MRACGSTGGAGPRGGTSTSDELSVPVSRFVVVELLFDREDALSLHGAVVHHGTPDTFGVEFDNLTPSEQRAVKGVIERMYRVARLEE